MARLPRLCVPTWPHLLIQKSHGGQPVFLDDSDRQRFHDLLAKLTADLSLPLHAYALRDDEVRLLLTPKTDDALSRLMQSLGRQYGLQFNRRHGRTGSLWEGRFRATVVEPERHLLDCMQFVEEPEGVHGDAGNAGSSDWSSLEHHLGQRVNPLVSDHLVYWSLGNTPFDREAAYRVLRTEGLSTGRRQEIADAVRKGWPLGGSAFVEMLSGQVERRLSPKPKGRPARASI